MARQIHLLRRYELPGWTDEQVLALPYSRFVQMVRVIQQERQVEMLDVAYAQGLIDDDAKYEAAVQKIRQYDMREMVAAQEQQRIESRHNADSFKSLIRGRRFSKMRV